MKLNQARQEAFLDAIRQGATKSEAAESVGVCRKTVSKLLRSDPSFASAVEDAEREAMEPILAKLREVALTGNLGAIMELLRAHLPDKFTPKTSKDITHKNANLTEEQYIELLKQRGINL